MKKRENFPQKNLGDFFRGGRIQGDVCGGDCWEIKDQIGEKKISGGQKFSGGTFWGNAKKGVEKLFGGSKKCWDFFGGHNNFLGENFSGKKKKSPGAFSGKFKKKNLGGIF